NLASKERIAILKELNIQVSNHMSTLDSDAVSKVEQHLKSVRNQTQGDRASEQGSNKGSVKKHQPSNNKPEQGETEKSGKLVGKKGQNKGQSSGQVGNNPGRGKSKTKGKGNQRRSDHRQSSNRQRGKRPQTQQQSRVPKPLPEKITFSDGLSVGELAKKLNRDASELIKKLLLLGMPATINQELDSDSIMLIAAEYGVETEEVILLNELEFETIEEVD